MSNLAIVRNDRKRPLLTFFKRFLYVAVCLIVVATPVLDRGLLFAQSMGFLDEANILIALFGVFLILLTYSRQSSKKQKQPH